MNNFATPFAGRPEVGAAEREGYVYYQTADNAWYRVQKNGLLQKHTGGELTPWETQTVDTGMSAAQILMQRLMGYTLIDSAAPRMTP